MCKLKCILSLVIFYSTSFLLADPKINFSGRIALDQISILQDKGGDQSSKLTNGGNLRDASLTLGIDFQNDLFFNWDLDFSPSGSGLGTLFLNYTGISNFSFMLGQVPSPFCLENSNSSKWLPHMERALASDAFKPCIGPGLTINHWGDNYLTAFSIRQGPFSSSKPTQSDRWGGTLRFVWAPVKTDKQVIHLGLSYSFQDTASQVTFKASPEIKNREGEKLVSLELPSKNYQVLGFEFSPLIGPFQLEAEYLRTFVKTREKKDGDILVYKDNDLLTYDGWHVGANYILTNHQRSYDMSGGRFGGVKTEDGGAWQLAARYSEIDLKKGGQEKNYSLALNWYVKKHIKVIANYVKAFAENREGFDDRELSTLAFRLQTVF